MLVECEHCTDEEEEVGCDDECHRCVEREVEEGRVQEATESRIRQEEANQENRKTAAHAGLCCCKNTRDRSKR